MNRFMSLTSTRAAVAAGLLGLVAVPAAAVNIPEGGAVTPDSVFVINFQVQEGCQDVPMDMLEVAVPDSVQNLLPEAVPGWDVTVETVTPEDEDAPEQTVVRWSGGPLEAGAFLEFGLRARFPDQPGETIAFPVVKYCGDEMQAWDGTQDDMPAPLVTLSDRLGPRDIADLTEIVEGLQGDLEALDSRLGGVDPENLRSRVSDAEGALQDLVERLDEIEAQLGSADASAEQATAEEGAPASSEDS